MPRRSVLATARALPAQGGRIAGERRKTAAAGGTTIPLRRYGSLRRRSDFARVGRQGRRRAAKHLTCLVADGRFGTRIGMTVSAQVGGAVVRNRVRRRLRAILDRYAFDGLPSRDIVFIARPGAGELSFVELTSEVERTFGPPS